MSKQLPERCGRLYAWRDTFDGETWSFETNGVQLVARKGDAAPDIDDGCRGPARDVRGWFPAILAAKFRALDVASMRSFVGEAQYEDKCYACDGDGRADDADGDCGCQNCLCDRCGGDGSEMPNMRDAVMGGIKVDANRVAQLLDCAPDGEPLALAALPDTVAAELPVLVLRGTSWLGLIVGLRTAAASAPVWNEAAE